MAQYVLMVVTGAGINLVYVIATMVHKQVVGASGTYMMRGLNDTTT